MFTQRNVFKQLGHLAAAGEETGMVRLKMLA